MIFEYRDLAGIKRSIELPIKKWQFKLVRRRVKNQELDDLGLWEFWILRDYLFQTLIFEKMKKEISTFFRKVQLSEFSFEEVYKGKKLQVVDIYYHYYYGSSVFMFAEPSNVFYPDGMVRDRLEIDMEYDTNELEHLLKQLLDAFYVHYESWLEDAYLSSDELEYGELFGPIITDCWLSIKEETKSDVFAMLSYATGGGGCTDMDNGNDVKETKEGVREYVKSKGIKVE